MRLSQGQHPASIASVWRLITQSNVGTTRRPLGRPRAESHAVAHLICSMTMETTLARSQRRVLALVSLTCILALSSPWPGSLSVVVTEALASGFSASFGDVLSTIPLLLLAAAVAVTVIHAWLRERTRRPALIGGVIGVVVALGSSEGLKALFQQPRPCTAWNLPTQCPPTGDWSLPSNHATLACAAVVVIAIATRSVLATVLAVVAALLVSVGRMIEGMHYLRRCRPRGPGGRWRGPDVRRTGRWHEPETERLLCCHNPVQLSNRRGPEPSSARMSARL